MISSIVAVRPSSDVTASGSRRAGLHGVDVDAREQLGLLGAQRRRRGDPELFGEEAAEVVVHPQRLGVPAGRRRGPTSAARAAAHATVPRRPAPRARRPDRRSLRRRADVRLGPRPPGSAARRGRSPRPVRRRRRPVRGRPAPATARGCRRSVPSARRSLGVERRDGRHRPAGRRRRRVVPAAMQVALGRRFDDPRRKAATEPGHVGLQRPGRVPRRSPRPQRLDRRVRRRRPGHGGAPARPATGAAASRRG